MKVRGMRFLGAIQRCGFRPISNRGGLEGSGRLMTSDLRKCFFWKVESDWRVMGFAEVNADGEFAISGFHFARFACILNAVVVGIHRENCIV